MKKLALFLVGLGSLATVSICAADNTPSQNQEPQYQEQCVPVTCYNDTVCNQLPCNVPVAQGQNGANTYCDPVPCTTATYCNPAPCATDTVCNPAPCAPVPVNTQAANSQVACTPAPCGGC